MNKEIDEQGKPSFVAPGKLHAQLTTGLGSAFGMPQKSTGHNHIWVPHPTALLRKGRETKSQPPIGLPAFRSRELRARDDHSVARIQSGKNEYVFPTVSPSVTAVCTAIKCPFCCFAT